MSAQNNLTYIFDTDAGADDIMALTFLLSRKDVIIEAITVCYGLAHGEQGAINLSKIVSLAGKEIPVYVGPEMPLENVGQVPFPDEWRVHSDQLPGTNLPEFYTKPRQEPAQMYLKCRLSDATCPVKILALGALTTLAAIQDGSMLPALSETVYMGGACNVAGNIHSFGDFVTPSKWNVLIDPTAASHVFLTCATPVLLVVMPLDATNKVPIDMDFIDGFAAMDLTPLGMVTSQILVSVRIYAKHGEYYTCWDMLAAVAMLERSIM